MTHVDTFFPFLFFFFNALCQSVSSRQCATGFPIRVGLFSLDGLNLLNMTSVWSLFFEPSSRRGGHISKNLRTHSRSVRVLLKVRVRVEKQGGYFLVSVFTGSDFAIPSFAKHKAQHLTLTFVLSLWPAHLLHLECPVCALCSYGYGVMLCILARGTIQSYLSAIRFSHGVRLSAV